ncbi:MAG TPA: site-specific integrase [Terriglobales bacterium]|nr:site-specific integrase [Terriglobales bacterium]
MARRSGQSPKPEVHGGWWTVRFWIDVPGQEARVRVRERICPISGPGLLPRPEIARKAKEIIFRSGADSPEYFAKVQAINQGTTFRQQAERWMNHIQTRKRKRVSAATAAGYRSYLNKWLNPNLGDLPLFAVDNKAGKELVAILYAANLAPKTIVEIVGAMKEVVASAVDSGGRRIFPREWNHEYMDVPVVDPKKQHRPTLTPARVSEVISQAEDHYRVIYALLAGTGLRIGEALAITLGPYSEEHTTISSDCKTIHVRRSVRGTKEQKPKTDNAIRSVDVCELLAAFLKEFVGNRTSGFLFQSDSGLPLLQSNIIRDSLGKLKVEGFHTFRRFRTSQLRKCRVPWDLEKFWIGHANKDVTDKYAEQLKDDIEYRQEWAEKVGLGFEFGTNGTKVTVVPIQQNAA